MSVAVATTVMAMRSPRVPAALRTALALAVPGGMVVAALWWWRFLLKYSRTETGLFNLPPPGTWANLWRLHYVVEMFADIAEFSSAYRSEDVNEAVGSKHLAGSSDPSWHLIGRAADLTPKDGYEMSDVRLRAEQLKLRGILRSYDDEGSHVHVQPEPNWRPDSALHRVLETFKNAEANLLEAPQ